MQLPAELALGRSKLKARFCDLPPSIVKAGESLAAVGGSSGAIYRLRSGWACQFGDPCNHRQAIVDVYLPGDVIGLDSALSTRPLGEILTLTSVTIEVIRVEDALMELFACRPAALYIAWLLGQRQRRADRLLASISGLDARGRLAMMVLDFYTRLSRRKLITGRMYNLPLTQIQIGNYLGLTVVHINRVLRSLRDDRIINLEKHCVTIIDLARLTSLARNEEAAPSNPDIAGYTINGAVNLVDPGQPASRDWASDARSAKRESRRQPQSRTLPGNTVALAYSGN
jgi:CRP/FNR family transcriptional regulator, anaerobic regulatory protein